MIGNDKTVKVTLVAVAQPYVAGLNQASTATRKLGSDIDTVGKRSKGLEGNLSGASTALKGMAAAGAAVAGTALIAFLRGSVEAASDLNETVSKTGQIFEDDAGELRDWAQTASESFGQSERAALDAASTFGVFGKSAGLVDDDLLGFSTTLTELASDMASFNNTSPEDAVTALGAALRGESEPIRRYGVLLDDATLKQKALELGIIDTTKEALTPQQKVLAAYSEILAQTGDQQGDFARTSDQLANQQRIMAARFEEARASLGEALLPAMTEAVELMIDGVDATRAIVEAFREIPTPVLAAAGALAAVHLAGPKLAAFATSARITMGAAGEALDYAGQAAARAGGGFAGAAAGLRTFTGQASLAGAAAKGLAGAGRGMLALIGGPWGAAFIGAAALIGKFVTNQQEARERVDELAASLDAQTGALTNNTRDIIANRLAAEGLLEIGTRLGIEQGRLTDALLGDATAQSEVNRAIERAIELGNEHRGGMEDSFGIYASNKKGAEDLRGAMGDLNGELDASQREWETLNAEVTGGNGAMELSAEAAQAAAGGQRDLAAETEAAAKAAEDAKKALDDYIDSLTASGLLVLSTRDATRAYEQALDDAKTAAEEAAGAVNANKDAFIVSTEEGRKAEAALDSQAKAAIALADAIYEETGSEAEFRASLATSREALEQTARDFGLSEEAAKQYADEILAIPDSHNTIITVDTSTASGQVLAITRQINGINDKTVYVNVVARQIGQSAASIRGGLTRDFDSGGYTGKGARLEPAGVVHKDEFVHTKAEMSKPGRLGFHYDLWRTGDLDAAYAKYKMRGYASGGPVSSSAAVRSVPVAAGVGIDYGRLARALAGMGNQTYNYPVHIGTLVAPDGSAAGLRNEAEAYRATRSLGA